MDAGTTGESGGGGPRLPAMLREGEAVSPLELFFDLVFVLAITQCTALMADNPTWQGLVQGLLVLAVLWWAWVGYSWLTSVVDPEDVGVRFVIFAAMAAMLIVALAVPEAFGDLGLLFAGAYAVVRVMHIALFTLASRGDPGLRRSVLGLAVSTGIAVSLLVAASQTDQLLQGALWATAIALDMGGPLLFGVAGWRLKPEHFAERHGLIMIIALGESIVAIGIGAEAGIGAGEVVAALGGIAIACALWWVYFDVVALVAVRRLEEARVGAEQNAIARDAYSIIHLPMIAGIVLLALGLKKTLEHVSDPLDLVVATAMLGGIATYLLAHVAFRYRNVGSINWRRVVAAAILIALIPAAEQISATLTVYIAFAVLVVLITYEVRRFSEFRERIRHQATAVGGH